MSTSSAPRGLRRLLTAAFATALIGAGGFGVHTLRAAPASFCEDPMLTCSLGGDPRCRECCLLTEPAATGGECAFGEVCLCTYD